MVLRNGQAYLGLCFEPTVLGEEVYVWRLERVFEWQHDLPMIDAFVKVRVLRTQDGEVPDEHVVLQGLSEQIFWSLLHHRLHLLKDAVLTDGLAHN